MSPEEGTMSLELPPLVRSGIFCFSPSLVLLYLVHRALIQVNTVVNRSI